MTPRRKRRPRNFARSATSTTGIDMTPDAHHLLPAIVALHDRIRASVVAACERQSHDAMSAVAHDDAGDTIYAVDKVSEETLIDGLAEIAREEPMVLVAEGLPPEG